MHDLTKGSIAGHLTRYASFIFVTMLFQTLYFLVDLYFVGRVGTGAVAAVSIAGNLMFAVLALTQSLGVGTTALVSQAVGAGSRESARSTSAQALGLALAAGLAFGVFAFGTRRAVATAFAADAPTAALTVAYFDWFVPAMALQFPMIAMASTLRGTGDVRRASTAQVLTVLLNVVLAPVLIAGWGTGRPLGVAGAGLASFIAMAAGVLLLLFAMRRGGIAPRLAAPDLARWRRIVAIGAPAGGEFLTMAVLLGALQSILAQRGPAAQAGFGVGVRVMQAIFLPAMAVSFAVAPIAGQNVGARAAARIRETFRAGLLGASALMAAATVVAQLASQWLVGVFTTDPVAAEVGTDYLRVISWNFVANGVIFVCGGMFQGFGNTLPSLFASSLRVGLYIVAASLLARQAGFPLRELWVMSVVSVLLQMVLVLWLLQREARRRFPEMALAAASPRSPESA